MTHFSQTFNSRLSRWVEQNIEQVAPEDVDTTNMDAFYILEGAYIDAALEQAVKDYGSMEVYIRDGLGITDTELEELKRQLLD